MATVLEQIEQAIKRGDAEQARELLRDELLSNPTAEAYYLASLVAFDEEQQREFLEKALAIYPFHKKAYSLLRNINFKRSKAAESGVEVRSTASPQSVAEPLSEIPSIAQQPVETLDVSQRQSTVMFPYAPISKRFVANFIDSVLILIAVRTLLTILGSYGLLPPETMPYIYRLTVTMVPNPQFLWINLIISTIISALYYIYFLCEQNGQTPGKRFRGIKVISLKGDKITPRQAFIRCIIGYWISGLFLLLGYLWAFWDPNRQAWHDKFAHTLVVKSS